MPKEIIHPPDSSNYPAHKCGWSFRNPRNHLSKKAFADLMSKMVKGGLQRIACPGCGRSIYLEMKIMSHNKPGMHGDPRPEADYFPEGYQ